MYERNQKNKKANLNVDKARNKFTIICRTAEASCVSVGDTQEEVKRSWGERQCQQISEELTNVDLLKVKQYSVKAICCGNKAGGSWSTGSTLRASIYYKQRGGAMQSLIFLIQPVSVKELGGKDP